MSMWSHSYIKNIFSFFRWSIHTWAHHGKGFWITETTLGRMNGEKEEGGGNGRKKGRKDNEYDVNFKAPGESEAINRAPGQRPHTVPQALNFDKKKKKQYI